MTEVISATGKPVWVNVQPDACFEEYGYYYEVFADKNGDRLLDWGNTNDPNESEADAIEWICGVAEITDYGV